MSRDDEQGLRERLDGALETITPTAPPVGTVLRKGKAMRARRQAGIVAVVAVAAGVAVAVAPGLLRQFSQQAPVTPARKPTVTVSPIGPGSRPGLIGVGTINGRTWRLVAERPGTAGAGKGQQCFQASGSASAGYVCQPVSSPARAGGDPVAFGAFGSSHAQLQYGAVTANVTRVTVALADGTVLALHPAEAYGQRYVVFAVPTSVAIARVVTYSRRGELGYSVPFNSRTGATISVWLRPGQRGLPRAARTIGGGTVDGTRWSEAVHEGPWGYCLTGKVGDCIETLSSSLGNEISNITGQNGGTTTNWAAGTATTAVDHVRVTLSGGISEKVQAVQCGRVRFFAFAIPKGRKFVRIDYYSAARRLIASETASQIFHPAK